MKRQFFGAQLGLLLVIALSTCTRQSKQQSDDSLDRARDQVLSRIAERYAKLSDYSVTGARCLSACASASPQVQHFALQLRSPGFFRIDLPDEQRHLAFDGQDFVSLDGKNKTAQRVNVAGGEDAALGHNSLLPYQVLSQFVIEGWRAPPLNTADSVPARWFSQDNKAAKSRAIVLSRNLLDSDLDHVDYVYHWPQGVFFEKRFVDKQGLVRKLVRVETSFSENPGRESYPKRWSSYDGLGKLLSWTELDGIEINRGLAKAHFSISVPRNFIPLP